LPEPPAEAPPAGIDERPQGRPGTQWTLQAGSPAVNAGTLIAGAPTTDFFGHTVPLGGAIDIGANEAR
jgi:hypothetical protein